MLTAIPPAFGARNPSAALPLVKAGERCGDGAGKKVSSNANRETEGVVTVVSHPSDLDHS